MNRLRKIDNIITIGMMIAAIYMLAYAILGMFGMVLASIVVTMAVIWG